MSDDASLMFPVIVAAIVWALWEFAPFSDTEGFYYAQESCPVTGPCEISMEKMSFRVHEGRQTVAVLDFIDQPIVLDDCQVFDQDNWTCDWIRWPLEFGKSEGQWLDPDPDGIVVYNWKIRWWYHKLVETPSSS